MFGFGEFPGQYGMVVLSKYPIVTDEVRTFQNLLWIWMPDARLPDDPATELPGDWYTAEELDAFRLSSKSHWDVPIDVDGRIVHALVSHPTPPVFDGEEDRNGTRNADEIRLWAEYIAGESTDWIVDDAGVSGGLAADAEFVILGDQNSDPVDGDSVEGAIQQLARPRPRAGPTADERGCRRGRRGTGPAQRASTRAIRRTTPPTSPTTRRATSAPTTCCRPPDSRSRRRRLLADQRRPAVRVDGGVPYSPS